MSLTRHVSSINDLSNDEIAGIFKQAQSYLDALHDSQIPYRIAAGTHAAAGKILATLFYEPSTRTRLSFESAMLRLGGQVISSTDSNTSSAAKGESLADTVRVISNYADILVVRHPRDGAARLAAEYASVPVINGGDGAHEHPTQTLCDLFTLQRRKPSLKDLHVAISGDLKGSRTVHSLVYALARFGANLVLMPAKGLELPEHVFNRLRDELHSQLTKAPEDVGALYVTAHEPELFEDGVDIHARLNRRIDAVYVTRFQKERTNDRTQNSYPTVNAEYLSEPKYQNASVMHPLPRVGELDQSLDTDKRAAYFEQAAYGVPVRMALVASLLGLEKTPALKHYEGGFRAHKTALVNQERDAGLQCRNNNCIVHDSHERPYVRSKFEVITAGNGAKLRCLYCETDVEAFVVADPTTGEFTTNTRAVGAMTSGQLKRVLVLRDEAQAREKKFKAGDPLHAEVR